jgi:serine phosphatase RsbU (regulator of sigma subunit)
MIYLFTDGYADQFGGDPSPGSGGKKFMYKNLKDILFANHTQSLSSQKQKLEQTFHEWKGNLDQVDDVCIIGIRI